MNHLKNLALNSIKLKNGFDKAFSLEQQCQKHKIQLIMNSLKLEDLNLKRVDHIRQNIGFRNIFMHEGLRISIYYLPLGEVMALHDHPSMEVLSYILEGSMEAKFYTQQPNGLFLKEQQILHKKSFSFIDGLIHNRRNLHEFRAISPTYFIDILFPDYDISRECSYFEEDPVQNPSQDMLRLRSIADPIIFHQM